MENVPDECVIERNRRSRKENRWIMDCDEYRLI